MECLISNKATEPWSTRHSRSTQRTSRGWTLLRSLTGEHISSVVLMYCHYKWSGSCSSNSQKLVRTCRLCFRTTTTTPLEMKKSLRLAVSFGFWIAPGGLSSASVGVWTPAVSISLPTRQWRPRRRKCFPHVGETGSLARGLRESRSEIKNKNKGSGKMENKYQETTEKRGRF